MNDSDLEDTQECLYPMLRRSNSITSFTDNFLLYNEIKNSHNGYALEAIDWVHETTPISVICRFHKLQTSVFSTFLCLEDKEFIREYCEIGITGSLDGLPGKEELIEIKSLGNTYTRKECIEGFNEDLHNLQTYIDFIKEHESLVNKPITLVMEKGSNCFSPFRFMCNNQNVIVTALDCDSVMVKGYGYYDCLKIVTPDFNPNKISVLSFSEQFGSPFPLFSHIFPQVIGHAVKYENRMIENNKLLIDSSWTNHMTTVINRRIHSRYCEIANYHHLGTLVLSLLCEHSADVGFEVRALAQIQKCQCLSMFKLPKEEKPVQIKMNNAKLVYFNIFRYSVRKVKEFRESLIHGGINKNCRSWWLRVYANCLRINEFEREPSELRYGRILELDCSIE